MDLPPTFLTDCKAFLEWFKPRLPEYDAVMTDNIIFQKRVQGLGKLDQKAAIDYAISGPMLRGSGMKWDLRRNDPYSIYDRFEFDIPVGTAGDVWDRYMVRRLEMAESVNIVEQALRDLPPGEIMGKVPKKLKPPVGDIYSRVESPRGELGFYLVSDGSEKPYRYKVRSPAFVNLSVLPEMGQGHLIAGKVAILGSIDIVLGEVDR